MLVWNDDEKDAFAELINVGMGLAASALSSMLGREFFLSVPSVEFISRQEMGQRFSRDVGNDIVGVRQAFQGAVEGNIALLFAKDSSFNLVGELVGDEVPLEDLPDIEQEAIAEVGNIVLNACLAAIADALHLKIPTGLPLFVRGIPVDLEDNDDEAEIDPLFLLSQVKFDLKDKDLSGFVVLVMTLPSAIRFKRELQNLISSYRAAE